MKLDPELGKYTRQHIYGEGMMDVFKSVGKKIFGKTMKKAAKKSGEKVLTMAATKTGEHAGKKAGDKIVQMLSKEKAAPPAKKVTFNKNVEKIPNGGSPASNTQQDVNDRVLAILSGGSTRKRKLYNY